MKETKGKIHPAIPEIKDDLDKGKLTRRDFLRYATLLEMSAAAAGQMVGLALPRRAFAATPKRGGILRVSAPVQKVTHPAQFSWLLPQNKCVRWLNIYLDRRKKHHSPISSQRLGTSDDLLTWTLNLRKGIKFNNGDNFTADDVVFTITQWKNKDVGSSMLGLMAILIQAASKKQIFTRSNSISKRQRLPFRSTVPLSGLYFES